MTMNIFFLDADLDKFNENMGGYNGLCRLLPRIYKTIRPGVIAKTCSCTLAKTFQDILMETTEKSPFSHTVRTRRPVAHATVITSYYSPPETRIHGLQFCRRQYIGSSSNFQTELSESQKRKLISYQARNRF